MKKRLLAILLAAIMVMSLLPTMAFAEVTKPEYAEWLDGAGTVPVWYKLTESDTVLTIGGEGAMPDYSNGSERPWHGKANSITSVVIEDGVTVIGKRAFLNFANVTELTVPASVKKVSTYAFKNSGLAAGITFAGKKAPTFMDHALDGVTAIKVPLKKIDAYKEAVGEDLAGIVSGYVNVTFKANNDIATDTDVVDVATGTDSPIPYILPSDSFTFTAPADKHFAGWARKPHGQVITDANITLTDDITLYAIWLNDTPLSDAASILNAAKDFEYDDGGKYNGAFTIEGTTIVYSAPENLPDPNKPDEVSNYKKLITNDFGAFFGTLYRFDNGASVTSIFYKGDEYTWNTEGTLRGSNWQKGGNGDTLISQLGNEIQAETGSVNITFKLNDDDVNLIAQTDLICTYPQKVTTPEDGKTYGLKLNGKEQGEVTLAVKDGGWSIKSGDKYLNAANGKLVLGDTAATAWTYKNGAFSTSVKTTQKNNGYWFGFLYIPGRGTKTVTTTYYLSTVTNGAKLSTCSVCAELYTMAADTHEYKYVNKCNGTHDKICKNCGEKTNESCVYDPDTHKCICGAYDPAKADVKISVVDVKEKTTKQFSGFLFWGTWKKVTTYTATIKTVATGVKVAKVEYQLNDSSKWITGSNVSSNKPIEKLNIRVLDSNGKWYTHEWPEGPEFMTVLDILATTENGDETFPVSLGGIPMNMWADENGQSYCFAYGGEGIAFMSGEGSAEDYVALNAEASKNGNDWVYTNPETGVTFTFHMTDDILTSITVANEPTGGDPDMSVLNGTYARRMFVADVLATLEDDFPVSVNLNAPDNAWKNANGALCMNVSGMALIFKVNNSDDFIAATTLDMVTESDDNWTLSSNGITITFVMDDGVLASIEVSGVPDEISGLNGTYTAPKFTVTFDLNGVTGTAPTAQTVASGEKATKPTAPTDATLTFYGWCPKDATTGKLAMDWDFDEDVVTANITLYAKWGNTIGDTVYTASDSFPTATSKETPPSGAWVADGNCCYLYNNNLCFYNQETYKMVIVSLSTNNLVIKDGPGEYESEFVYQEGDLTITFKMMLGELVSITYNSTADTIAPACNGTYVSPDAKTIGDILATADSAFPSVSEISDGAPTDAWTCSSILCYEGNESSFFKADVLCFKDGDCYWCIPLTEYVVMLGTDYIYYGDDEGTHSITFKMTDEKLTSINFDHSNSEYDGFNGIYEPAAGKTVADLASEVSGWDDGTLKEIDMSYTGGNLVITNNEVSPTQTISLPGTTVLTASGDNWTCTENGVTYTFVMSAGHLMSVTVVSVPANGVVDVEYALYE